MMESRLKVREYELRRTLASAEIFLSILLKQCINKRCYSTAFSENNKGP